MAIFWRTEYSCFKNIINVSLGTAWGVFDVVLISLEGKLVFQELKGLKGGNGCVLLQQTAFTMKKIILLKIRYFDGTI